MPNETEENGKAGRPAGSKPGARSSDLRATVEDADIEELSDDDVELLRDAAASEPLVELAPVFDSLSDDHEEPATDAVEMPDVAPPDLSQLNPPELAADLDDLSEAPSAAPANPWRNDPDLDELAAAAAEEESEEEPDDAELARLADEMGLGLDTDPPAPGPTPQVVPAPKSDAQAAKPLAEPPEDTRPEIEVSDELARDEAGLLELGAVSGLKVLYGCALSRSSGIARFRDARGTVKLYYRQGIIEGARSTIPELSLRQFLLERGVCSEASLDAAQAELGGNYHDLASGLVGQGALDAPRLNRELTEWIKRTLGELAGWTAGACHFLEGRVPAPLHSIGLDRFKPLEEAVRVGFTPEQLGQRLERVMARSLIVKKGGEASFEDLRLYPSEQSALSRLDDEKTLAELLTDLEGSADAQAAALRAVFLGIESDLVQIGPGPVARAQIRRTQELENELVLLRQKGSFFEVLGVTPESSDIDVKQRYLDLLDHYTKDTAAKELPQLTQARSKISELLEKAFAALATKEKRERGATVVARISPVSQGSAPARMPSIFPGAKAQSSVELFEEAEAAARKANYALCLQKIDEAIDARPDRLQYRLYKEYYKALSDKYDRITAASNAIKEIAKLVGDNERVAEAHLLMGRLYKFARKKAEAGEAFERVLELEPDNVEAQTEVRIKTNRAAASAVKQPSRAESAISFFKNLVSPEDDDPKKKKKKKPPPT